MLHIQRGAIVRTIYIYEIISQILIFPQTLSANSSKKNRWKKTEGKLKKIFYYALLHSCFYLTEELYFFV